MVSEEEPNGNSAGAEHQLSRRRLGLGAHQLLRELIVQGDLLPGAVLSQAGLARELGISRGPVREAFRQLQEEGLITAEPDQRPRVAGFDPISLDSLYGARITLETLGARLTSQTRTPELLEAMHRLIEIMDEGVENYDLAWRKAHRQFHAAVASGAGPIASALTVSLAERSEVYYRLYGPGHAGAHSDHREVLAAIEAGDPDESALLHSRHVSRTALTVLANMAPTYEPGVIRASLRIFDVDEAIAR